MPTLICFALKEEAAPFRKIAADKAATVPAGISILLTGIGTFGCSVEPVARNRRTVPTLHQPVRACGLKTSAVA
jgi:hypothetical protein